MSRGDVGWRYAIRRNAQQTKGVIERVCEQVEILGFPQNCELISKHTSSVRPVEEPSVFHIFRPITKSIVVLATISNRKR